MGVKENNSERIVALKGVDIDENREATKNAALLKLRQRQLRTVLSIVGKCVSSGHYDAVMRHSTSLESIYDMLRSDYDMQKKGIHFLNLLDMKFDATNLTPIAFYNQYRTMITSNLAKTIALAHRLQCRTACNAAEANLHSPNKKTEVTSL